MARSRRNCISMRDVTYIALRLYKERLNAGPGPSYSIGGLGEKILQGEAPPIPQGLLKEAEGVAVISREKRAAEDEARKGNGPTPFTPPPPKGEDSLLSQAIREEKIETSEGGPADDPDDGSDDERYGGIVTF